MTDCDSFELVNQEEITARKKERRHVYRSNAICVTDKRASIKYEALVEGGLPDEVYAQAGDARFEIVVDASEGFVPLWAEHSTIRWRFEEVSLQAFRDPNAAKRGLRELFGNAIAEWGAACPVTFLEDEGRYDFEIVMRSQRRCSVNGCVLASAFFPDGGQHELTIYPSMFDQSRQEQVETLIHEIGHIFGLRHFFALVSEGAWPAIIYGEHQKFSIMNYGSDSRLTDVDKSDLQSLYQNVWNGRISAINGTPIRLMRPFSSQFL